MDEDDNVNGGEALNGTSAGAGLSGEDKQAELLPAVLPFDDDAGLKDAGAGAGLSGEDKQAELPPATSVGAGLSEEDKEAELPPPTSTGAGLSEEGKQAELPPATSAGAGLSEEDKQAEIPPATSAGAGSSEEDKQAELPPAILPFHDDAGLKDASSSKKKGKRGTAKKDKNSSSLQSTKLVPVWYLFRFANPLDIFMIVVGTFMAMAAGTALPSHILLFGDVIDYFIAYDLAVEFMDATNAALNNSMEMLNATNATSEMMPEYFCNETDSSTSARLALFLNSSDPGSLLQSEIGQYSLYYVALALALLVASYISTIFWNLSAYRQTRRLRQAFFRAIMKQEIGWFDVNPSAQLNSRLSDDIEKIQSGIGDKAALFLQYFSTFITGFVVAFVRSWQLTLVVATSLPLLTLLAATIARVVASFTVREQNAYAKAGGIAEEVISAIRTVTAFGGQEKEVGRYSVLLDKAKVVGYKKSLLTSIATGLLYFVVFSTYALGFWYGSTLIVDCELGSGEVVTVFFSVIIGSFSLGNALPEIQTFAAALGSATAIFSILDRKSKIDPTSDEGEIPNTIEGNVKFEDVVFAYPARSDVQVLHGLDLEVKVGQTMALVGPSGCGKSTVVQLLQRFYEPIGGLLTIDGYNIRDLNLKWLRSNIGVVSQEPVLFDTSIAENIRYGREDATKEDIERAAKGANAHNFISSLPDGYETQVGERGTQLSGGQKQRIAIARALVRDPKILLLDEATSALDTESEKIVQEALDKAREGRTTIVIAHRLSTIQTADVITSIERGRVVERGSHSELMDKEGLYYELVTAQTIDDEEDENEPLSGFKAALRRSVSRYSVGERESLHRQSSSVSWSSQVQRQASQDESDIFSAFLGQSLSRFSVENLPVASHPSPGVQRPSISEFTADDFKGVDEDEVVFPTSRGTPERSGTAKMVHFTAEDELVEVETGRKRKWKRSSRMGLLRRSKKSAADDEVEELDKIKFLELLALNLPDWYLVLLGVICAALLGALFPTMAIIFSGILEIFSSTDQEELLSGAAEYAGYFVALAVGAGTVQFLGTFTLSLAGERLTKRLRLQTFQAILRQEMSWFDKKTNSTGALTTRLATSASEVKGATGISLGTTLQTVAGLIVAMVIAFEASWVLAIVLFACFPLLAAVGYLQIKLQQGRSARNKHLMEESGKTSVEAIDQIRTVSSLGLELKFSKRYDELLTAPFKSNIKSVYGQGVVFALAQSSIFFIYSAGFYLGAYLVISDEDEFYHATYDEIFRVFAAVVFTALSVGRASSFAPDVTKARQSASRILTLIRREPPIDAYSKDGLKLETTNGEVTLKDVTFTYPSRPEAPILQGLSLSVKSGQTVALVGPSGCGKSTVVSLIERFYDPLTGSLLIDDTHASDLNIRWLRSQIGIVSQEPVLFDLSIAENIRYGALFREVSDEEVIEAAKAANIDNFIQTLPEGYNTNVGAKGTQLSGGQKQRIAIARALVRDPKILLLDEATSALDTESEKIVQEALDKAREGRTSIVIAHRLSTIYNSDCIAVIHNGKVLESGTHGELMALKGAYYLLNTIQKKEDDD